MKIIKSFGGISLKDWRKEESDRREKEATDDKNIQDGLNRREPMRKSGYGRAEHVEDA